MLVGALVTGAAAGCSPDNVKVPGVVSTLHPGGVGGATPVVPPHARTATPTATVTATSTATPTGTATASPGAMMPAPATGAPGGGATPHVGGVVAGQACSPVGAHAVTVHGTPVVCTGTASTPTPHWHS
jgi:hypothetical protein